MAAGVSAGVSGCCRSSAGIWGLMYKPAQMKIMHNGPMMKTFFNHVPRANADPLTSISHHLIPLSSPL